MKIDFDKPITVKQQFQIMLIILLISCILFTAVYIIKSKTPQSGKKASAETQISQTQQSSASNSSADDESSQTVKLKNIKNISKSHDEIYNGDLILVDKDYECHHDGDQTVSLFENKTNTYGVTDNSVSINKNVINSMNNMFDDFQEKYGANDVMVACGYRSYDLQVQLYNEEVDNKGDKEAEQWVAPPGYSEHQSGYAFDLNLSIDTGNAGIKYDGTGIYSWINSNSYKYGFILRYLSGKEKITGYEYEPWHFRYVGLAHATYIMKKKITLEEYIDIVHKHSINNPLVINGDSGQKWSVYYVKAQKSGKTSIPVSKDYKYQISGDNYSGFIVTQKIK